MLPDVRTDHLQIVKEILSKYIHDNEIYIFGSRANGNAKHTSDLDLFIKGSVPIELGILAHLRYAFSESNLPYKVDVIDWSVISDNFKKTITKNKIIKLDINKS